jgi:hypothetical protein
MAISAKPVAGLESFFGLPLIRSQSPEAILIGCDK